MIVSFVNTKIRDNINKENKSDFWDLQKLHHAIEVEIGHLPSVEATTSLDDDDDDSLLVTSEISKPSSNVSRKQLFCNVSSLWRQEPFGG